MRHYDDNSKFKSIICSWETTRSRPLSDYAENAVNNFTSCEICSYRLLFYILEKKKNVHNSREIFLLPHWHTRMKEQLSSVRRMRFCPQSDPNVDISFVIIYLILARLFHSVRWIINSQAHQHGFIALCEMTQRSEHERYGGTQDNLTVTFTTAILLR